MRMDVFGDRSLSGGWVNKSVRLTRGFSSLDASTTFICSFALACAAICAVPGIARAQDSSDTEQETYIWPLEGRYALTSTFAEYRSGHFHAGVDISTGGRTGLPMYLAFRLKLWTDCPRTPCARWETSSFVDPWWQLRQISREKYARTIGRIS